MQTGFATHELFFWFDHGPAALFRRQGFIEPGPHVESPEAKRRVRGLLEASGILQSLKPLPAREATDQELLLFHTREHLDRVAALSAGPGGDSGEGAWVPNGGDRIARLSAGTAIATAEAVVTGEVRNAYALLRPAGHHAVSDMGMGFCIYNNVVLATQVARVQHGVQRALIIDWDVHHGNGTQSAFYGDPDALTISIHQDGLYPASSGRLEETGEGPGEGRNINVPLPAGSGHEAYTAVARRILAPAIEKFRPDLILVSCGFDSAVFDPLGRMLCHADTYREMIRIVMQAAENVCGGRLVVVHEGGYSPVYAPYCGLAVVEELSGKRIGVDDPFPFVRLYPDQAMKPTQLKVIEAAESLVTGI